MSQTPVASLGQFLMSRTVSQAYFISSSINPLSEYDNDVLLRILENNWNTEEQMISNILLCPIIIPENVRLKYLLKGIEEPGHPYYILASSAGIQSLPNILGNSQELIKALRNTVLNEPQGLIAVCALNALQKHLNYPDDLEFYKTMLKKHNSSLFQYSLSWLLSNVKDRLQLLNIVQSEELPSRSRTKASEIIKDCFERIDDGKEANLSLEALDFIPNFDDFDAMLDKEETLSDFFVDIDTNKDGRITFEELLSFLEDIGKKIDVEKLKKEIEALDGENSNGYLGRDDFIELMFPKFQIN